MNLANQSCEACNVNSKPMTHTDINNALTELTHWQLIKIEAPRFERTFEFKNFEHALTFVNLVGKLAEEFNHHPKLTLEWGKVTVQWWTHKIKNVHATDAIMAAKSDAIFLAL